MVTSAMQMANMNRRVKLHPGGLFANALGVGGSNMQRQWALAGKASHHSVY